MKSVVDPGNTASYNVSTVALASGANNCTYRITVSHPSGGWNCTGVSSSLGHLLQPLADAIGVEHSDMFASQPAVNKYVAPTPAAEDDTLPFSPYVIIIPAVIVVVLLTVCLGMWCARPKVKRQERPVFDGFEMGDAQQLESTSNLEFAVPEVEFEDTRGGNKHRLTIN